MNAVEMKIAPPRQSDFGESCLEAGMDGYLAKSIQPRELFEVLERVGTKADCPA